jgi:hypothetical protein
VFAIAAETGWPEERIMFMPLARLFQYQHCLLRRNGIRTSWNILDARDSNLKEVLESMRSRWGTKDCGWPSEMDRLVSEVP